ncbi:Uncharacterised protein [Burkholderia pseudomallei]|nr:onnB domain protein [Burkholderia mallei]CAJ3317076.1 Uncharacterised protein [Burkholderia pseudomallei]KOT25791.1 onnB domain protein [Burkholderia mallei]CAJ3342485.1 Uncharacterised protein [Burkholderia pseudomallei]CAJ3916726.1 Uncharacterised protein [Burkholderia pseudomallei]
MTPAGAAHASAGYSDRIRCALVPPAPNADTPAVRGSGTPSTTTRSQSHSDWFTIQREPSSGRSGFSSREWSDGTIWRCASCSSTFVSAAMPAAPSQWPMFDFTEPIRHGPFAPLSANPRARPASSIGSPSAVPVPCAST